MKRLLAGSSTALLVVLMMLAPVGASAAGTTFADRASFDAAVPDATLEDWEDLEVANNSVVTCAAPLDETCPAVGPGDVADGLTVTTVSSGPGKLAIAGTGFSGVPSKQVVVNFTGDTLILEFSTDVSAFAADLFHYYSGATCTVQVLDTEGELLEAFMSGCGPTGTFFGVSFHHELIGKVHISGPAFESADNIAFGLVTTPTILWAEPSILDLSGPAPTLTFTAWLTALGNPLSGRTIDFSVGGAPVCSGVTDDDGRATCGGPLEAVGSVPFGYDAEFGGERFYDPSTAHGDIIR